MHGDNAAALALWGDFFQNGMAAALAINEESESLQALTASAPDTMGSLAMSQFERADRGWLFQGLRE